MAAQGFLWVNFDPAQPTCATEANCETFLVRDALDANTILKGLLSQINCTPALYTNSRLLISCLTLKTTIKLAMLPKLACYEIMISLFQVQTLQAAGAISAQTAASWTSQLTSAATLRQCPGYTVPVLVPAGAAPAGLVAETPSETLASK